MVRRSEKLQERKPGGPGLYHPIENVPLRLAMFPQFCIPVALLSQICSNEGDGRDPKHGGFPENALGTDGPHLPNYQLDPKPGALCSWQLFPGWPGCLRRSAAESEDNSIPGDLLNLTGAGWTVDQPRLQLIPRR